MMRKLGRVSPLANRTLVLKQGKTKKCGNEPWTPSSCNPIPAYEETASWTLIILTNVSEILRKAAGTCKENWKWFLVS